MAARFIQLLCMSCHVCMILHVCSIQGVACDVPDDVVYTDLHRHVRIGDSVALTCQFRGTPLAVYWKKLDDPTRVTTLVSWLKGDPATGLCVGERPCEIMEMNEDFSLVIKKVSIAEQGRYICKVANYKGILIQNVTEISVFSPPKKPYPVINECLMSPDMKSKQTCVISTAEDPVNISCTVSGYFPDIDLFFLSGSRYITTIHSEEMTNGDGKKNRSITIQASPRPEQYFCVASDIPGVGGRRVASLLVTIATTPVNRADSTLAEKIVAPLIVIIVSFAVILIAIMHLHRRIRQQGAWKADGKAGQTEITETGKAATEETVNVVLYHGGIANNEQGARNLDQKAGQKEGTETGNAATEELCQEGTPIDNQGKSKGKVGKKDLKPVAKDNESTSTVGIQEAYTSVEGKGASQNSEDPKSSGKASTDTNNLDSAISGEESSSTKEEDLMQEMSRDGAAESKENTIENVDKKEQGNTPDGSDERKRDDSSETRLLVPAELDHWGRPIDSSQYMDPTTAGYQAFI